MARRFMDFLELAPRSRKPRSRGLTTVTDQGQPMVWLSEMLGLYGEFVDGVKFTPSCLCTAWDAVEKRVKLYRDHNLEVGSDDPIFSIAYYQGKADELLRTLREIGFTQVQIDTHHMDQGGRDGAKKTREEELRYMALARDLGFKIKGEVGKKWPEGDRARAARGLLHVEAIISEMNRLLTAGCEHVYLESRVIREAIGEYGERETGSRQIRQVVEAVGQDKVFIEISGQLPFDTKQCHRFWAVRNFGPEVNMGGGGSIEEVRHVEPIRRGFAFVSGPSRTSSKLWLKSLAKNGGKAAVEWWKEEYPIDPQFVKR